MTTFQVDDMSCSHCVNAITQAVKALDASAHVEVNLTTKCVDVESARLGAPALADAIREAGYTPVVV